MVEYLYEGPLLAFNLGVGGVVSALCPESPFERVSRSNCARGED